MKARIALAISLFWMSSLAFGSDFIRGFVTEFSTSNEGVFFNLNCEPSHVNLMNRINLVREDMRKSLHEIYCEVKKIQDPNFLCPALSDSTPSSCSISPKQIVKLHKDNPNYLGILSLLNTAYTTQNPIMVEGEKIESSETRVLFGLLQMRLD